MSAPTPSLGLLQAQVAEILEKHPEARAIGFRLNASWTGPSTLQVGGEELPLAFCPSALAFRAELVEREGSATPFILFTDREARELGEDVLARLCRKKLFQLNSWQALGDRLGVRAIDPRLLKLAWLPDHLLALPEQTIARPATPVLDAEDVWQALLARLGFSNPRPDLRDLLEWTASPERLDAFRLLTPEVREAYTERIAGSAGGAGYAVLRLAATGRGSEAVAAGLVCEVLFPPDAPTDAERARVVGRFEALLLAGERLEPEAGRAWAEAAAGRVRERLETAGERAISAWQEQAKLLLAELGVQSLGERSTWLPAAFARTVADFAAAFSGWLDQPEAERLPELAEAAARVRGHGLVASRAEEARAVAMTLRLGRWLAARKGGQAPVRSFAEAVASYAQDGSFADLARTALADAHLSLPLGAVRSRLFRAVLEQREAESRRFAELLAGWSEAPTATDALIPIESVLDRVVAPLAAAGPVLLLILDGMSFAVFRELTEDLPRRDWEEVRPQGTASRLYGVGLLPTATQVCRTSLLCGDRRTGSATVESQGFQGHPGLRRYTSPALPPVLFHKSDLGSDGTGLAASVRDEIARVGRRVVAVVLNVVDDQLPRGQQLVPRWEIPAIRFLEETLQSAADAGRTVVLVSDHGHVEERETELRRQDGGGARFRPLGPPPGEGEVVIRGPRVLLGEESGLVLAWSERLRYSNLQSGYHGGASPQEVVVPISVWAPFGSEVPGWEPAPTDLPDWWQEDAVPAPVQPAATPVSKPRTKAAEAVQPQGDLFPAPSHAGPGLPERWLVALFSSPVYHEQRGRAGRQSLTDEMVGTVLRALEQRGGRMTLAALTHQLGLALPRVQGLLAALQRVLNVEGFPVLALGPDLETVVFDRGMLEKQFPPGERSA